MHHEERRVIDLEARNSSGRYWGMRGDHALPWNIMMAALRGSSSLVLRGIGRPESALVVVWDRSRFLDG